MIKPVPGAFQGCSFLAPAYKIKLMVIRSILSCYLATMIMTKIMMIMMMMMMMMTTTCPTHLISCWDMSSGIVAGPKSFKNYQFALALILIFY